ncbi:MAG: DEAD/DEAH box helicase [Myxococcales bacterium]|nr:DEAD/DEAH box helicase [Myxococcales bacterium]
MKTFEALELIEPIRRALGELGYTTPTPIQQKAIPPLLARRDLLGCAQTGTGKTAAFALPTLQHLDGQPRPGRNRCRALVLTPTRELALQVEESFRQYGRHLRVSCAVIFGGVGKQRQIDTMRRGVDVLVATPGRLLDLMGEGHISLAGVEYFVLDEADRMLDMGFIHDVRKVIAAVPDQRQTLLFSATMPEPIRELSAKILRDPVHVAVDPVSSTTERVDQCVMYVDKADKPRLLEDLLGLAGEIDRALVFTRTKHGANRLAKHLQRVTSADAIHGNKSQNARQRALEAFRTGEVRVLVATDIAARGIDIDEISHVINFDLPTEPESYVHRIGRTGRAGASGVAITFCQPDERGDLRAIERLIGLGIPVVDGHSYEPTGLQLAAPPMPANAAHRSGSGNASGNRRRRGRGGNRAQAPSRGQGQNRSQAARRPRH